jgi:hypothetical protein
MTAGTNIVTLPLVFPIHNSENRDPFDCAPHLSAGKPARRRNPTRQLAKRFGMPVNAEVQS